MVPNIVAAKITKDTKKPKKGQVFGSNGVFYSFLQGDAGQIQIRVDFGSVPEPAAYYYADSLRLKIDEQQQMAIISFGRRQEHANTFRDRIDVAMPMKALFNQFWASSLSLQSIVDAFLESVGLGSEDLTVIPPEAGAQTGADVTMLFGNMIFAAVGEGETSLDFYHLPPREVHLAKTQKKEIRIQPIVRVIMSSVLTKCFFNTLRPHAERLRQPQAVVERTKRVARSH